MAFATESNIERLQEKELIGCQKDAAVDCWFTSTGKSIPRLVKIQDDTGALLTIGNIRILKTEQKFYAGILARRYWCRAAAGDVEKAFVLVFYPEANKWKMII